MQICFWERDEVGTALWSHVCIVIVGAQDPTPGGQPVRGGLHCITLSHDSITLGLWADEAYLLRPV